MAEAVLQEQEELLLDEALDNNPGDRFEGHVSQTPEDHRGKVDLTLSPWQPLAGRGPDLLNSSSGLAWVWEWAEDVSCSGFRLLEKA